MSPRCSDNAHKRETHSLDFSLRAAVWKHAAAFSCAPLRRSAASERCGAGLQPAWRLERVQTGSPHHSLAVSGGIRPARHARGPGSRPQMGAPTACPTSGICCQLHAILRGSRPHLPPTGARVPRACAARLRRPSGRAAIGVPSIAAAGGSSGSSATRRSGAESRATRSARARDDLDADPDEERDPAAEGIEWAARIGPRARPARPGPARPGFGPRRGGALPESRPEIACFHGDSARVASAAGRVRSGCRPRGGCPTGVRAPRGATTRASPLQNIFHFTPSGPVHGRPRRSI